MRERRRSAAHGRRRPGRGGRSPRLSPSLTGESRPSASTRRSPVEARKPESVETWKRESPKPWNVEGTHGEQDREPLSVPSDHGWSREARTTVLAWPDVACHALSWPLLLRLALHAVRDPRVAGAEGSPRSGNVDLLPLTSKVFPRPLSFPKACLALGEPQYHDQSQNACGCAARIRCGRGRLGLERRHGIDGSMRGVGRPVGRFQRERRARTEVGTRTRSWARFGASPPLPHVFVWKWWKEGD